MSDDDGCDEVEERGVAEGMRLGRATGNSGWAWVLGILGVVTATLISIALTRMFSTVEDTARDVAVIKAQNQPMMELLTKLEHRMDELPRADQLLTLLQHDEEQRKSIDLIRMQQRAVIQEIESHGMHPAHISTE